MLRAAVAVTIFAGCASLPSDDSDVPVGRYIVDSVTVPTVAGQAAAFGYDFNDDGEPDNSFGNITTVLAAQGDITSDVGDLVSEGVFTSTIEIDRSGDGETAYVTWDSLAMWSASFTNTEAITNDGPQSIAVTPRVPALIDADPTPLALDEVAMQLIPDADDDGYAVHVQALAGGTAFRAAAASSLVQMVESNPRAHLQLASDLDTDHDGVLSATEGAQSPLMQVLAASDQPNDQISIGYRFHITSCDAGWCNGGPVVDHCHDRIVDADETGLDCGGSCHPCSAGLACNVDADCDSQTCVAGTCQAPTCDDGILDGLELAVDCGNGCPGCGASAPCYVDADCASGACSGGGLDVVGRCR